MRDGPSAILRIAGLLLLALLTLGWLVSGAPFAVAAPSTSLVINTAAALLALVLALLTFARHAATGLTSSVVEASAFFILAVANALAVGSQATGLDRQLGLATEMPSQLPFYLWGFARLVAATLLVLATRPWLSRVRLSRAAAMVVLFVPSLALVGVVLVGSLSGGSLPPLVDPQLLPELAGPSSFPGRFLRLEPITEINLLTGLLFLAAAGAYARSTAARGAILVPYLVVGLTIAAFAEIHYALHPASFTGSIATGDVLLIGSYVILFVGLERATREDLLDQRLANERLQEGQRIAIDRAAFQEREQLARELHDGVVQRLWAAGLNFERLRSVLRTDTEPGLRMQADRFAESLDAAAAEARRALHLLRSGGPSEAILDRVLPERLHELSDRWGYATSLRDDDNVLSTVRGRRSLEVMRICDEALTNAHKHADATAIRICAERVPTGIEITVSDNGRGIGTAGEGGSGVGLIGMRERAALIGAELTIESGVHDGTRVRLLLPVDEDAPA